MPQLFELKQEHHAAITRAEQVIAAAENANRPLTASESETVDTAIAEAKALEPQISTLEKANTLRSMVSREGRLSLSDTKPRFGAGSSKKSFSRDYAEAFSAFLASGGQTVNAALYEGSNSAGGYAVPVITDDQIVPLAPQEMSIRQLATIIPTSNDIKIPRKTTYAVATGKAESGATANSFSESEGAIDQFTLSAFMAGVVQYLSWELVQDVPAFQAFAIQDMLTAQQQYEEGTYVSGTGTGQAQGLIGNVGAGVTEEPDANGNLVSIDGTLDLIGSLNAVYHPNASFLMSRPTSIIIRKAQRQANLFEPVWTRSNGTDYLHGYPVGYASTMPTAARGACPVLFGDFKQGYVIGDRGGSGINIKILDQPRALQGQLMLLAYRRTDGRVRRSEAIQSYNIASS
jgi:HK97 family phage major capsid protein